MPNAQQTVLHNAGTTPASNRQGSGVAAVGEDVQADAFAAPWVFLYF